jgi:hypothetical protein
MTRVNRPDTLYTELREIQRRLRLLEGVGARGAALSATAGSTPALASSTSRSLSSAGGEPLAAPSPLAAVALSPARPADWPATRSAGWEGLLWTMVPARIGRARLIVETLAEADTAGQIRAVIEGAPVGGDLPATAELARHTIDLPISAADSTDIVEIAVQARRVSAEAWSGSRRSSSRSHEPRTGSMSHGWPSSGRTDREATARSKPTPEQDSRHLAGRHAALSGSATGDIRPSSCRRARVRHRPAPL